MSLTTSLSTTRVKRAGRIPSDTTCHSTTVSKKYQETRMIQVRSRKILSAFGFVLTNIINSFHFHLQFHFVVFSDFPRCVENLVKCSHFQIEFEPHQFYILMSQARATTGHWIQTVKRCLTMGTSAVKGRGSLIPSLVVMAVQGLLSQATARGAAPNTLPLTSPLQLTGSPPLHHQAPHLVLAASCPKCLV